MTNFIDLQKLISEMEIQFDEYKTFFNKKKGELVTVSYDNLRDIEDGEIAPPYNVYSDWEKEELKNCQEIISDFENYIEIPSSFDIDEYNIMEDFCLSIEDDKLSNEMYSAIKGKGAFARFKEKIHRYNIENDWYDYKENRLKEIAINWCKDNDIKYKD